MEIRIPAIAKEGQRFDLLPQEEWVRDLVRDFQSFLTGPIELLGYIQLFRVEENVSLSGNLDLSFYAMCDRCGQKYKAKFFVPVKRYIVPYFGSEKNENSKKELELQEDDLEFSTYFGESIDLSSLISEEINLALPINFYCRTDCAGLCFQCKKNLNEGPCQCKSNDKPSPFAALRKLSFPDKLSE